MDHPSPPPQPSILPSAPRPSGIPIPIFAVLAFAGLVLALRSAETDRTAAAAPAGPPVGTIVAFAGPRTAVPEAEGWLLCDGREVSVAQYPALHAVLGSGWGTGSGSESFRLPDLRGRFLRGVQYDATGDYRDPDRETRGSAAPGGNSGNEVGSLQEDAAGPHQHPLIGAAYATGQGAGAEWVRFYSQKVPDESAPALTSTWAVGANTGSETRPRNVYVNWIVRAR